MQITKRWLLIALMVPVLAITALLARADSLSEEDVNRLVRSYILENPEIIVEAITILQQREQAQQQAGEGEMLSRLQDDLIANPGDPVLGNPNGSVTLVEFSDYNCGFCKRAHDTVEALIESNPDLRVVLKEFPILSETSMTAARAALAVNDLYPEQYAEFHGRLMAHRGSLQNDNAVWSIVRALRVDVGAVQERSRSADIEAAVARNHELARQLNITGTPTFIVGNSVLRGALPKADIQRAIDDAS
ncbi:MAG: DsbA family protein [Saccharospirillum sp.]|nr:DsbA family protein [Saccharospirillum sp.]